MLMFGARSTSICWGCGSTQHRREDCPVVEQNPVKPNVKKQKAQASDEKKNSPSDSTGVKDDGKGKEKDGSSSGKGVEEAETSFTYATA